MNWNAERKQSLRPRRKRRARKKRVQIWNRAAALFLLLMFVVSGTVLCLQWNRYRQSEQAYEGLRSGGEDTASSAVFGENTAGSRTSRKDFSALKAGNPDTVAWLTGSDPSIDYPVMYTDNNEYYLHHLYSGEENRYGALFVDCRNTGLFTDVNTVIYGHNMNNDAMFGSLMGYKSQSYYEEHPTMTLCTPAGDYTIELLSGTLESGEREFVRFSFASEEDFTAYIQNLRSRSTFESPAKVEYGDRLVSLCTCTYEQSNARYLVVGRLLPAPDAEEKESSQVTESMD